MKKVIALVLALCIGVIPVFSKESMDAIPRGNWALVQSMGTGASVSVQMSSGDRVEGHFLGLDADSIRLRVDKQERFYPRSDVAEIWQLRIPDGKTNGALYGIVAGAAAGVLAAGATGTLEPTGDTAGRQWGAGLIMAGIGIGALVGVLADAAIKGDKLLYRK